MRWDALTKFYDFLASGAVAATVEYGDAAFWVRQFLGTPDMEFAPGEPTPDIAAIVGERIRYDQGLRDGMAGAREQFRELARTATTAADAQGRRAQEAEARIRQAQAFLDTDEQRRRALTVPEVDTYFEAERERDRADQYEFLRTFVNYLAETYDSILVEDIGGQDVIDFLNSRRDGEEGA